MPDMPSTIVLASTSTDAGDRIVDMEKNFMAAPFILPAVSLCYKEYAMIFNSSVRYHTHAKQKGLRMGEIFAPLHS